MQNVAGTRVPLDGNITKRPRKQSKTRTINYKDNSKYELREDERHIPVTLQGLQLDNNTAAVLSERAVDLELIDD
jgi:hypothetical protein